jgi:hypothetical protein
MDIERIREIYAELDKYSVTLHPDPVTLGPKYLQDTIAKIRNFLNAVTKLLLDVQAERHQLSREIRRSEDAFKIVLDETMASDERVKKQPNIRDREALAHTIHAEEVKAISVLKLDMDSLLLVEKAIRHRHNELRDTMADVKTQKSLIQSEIDTGSMYGDERVPRSNLTMPSEEITEEEAERILSGESESKFVATQVVSFGPPEVEDMPEPTPVMSEQKATPSPIKASVEITRLPDTAPGVETPRKLSENDELERFLNGGELKKKAAEEEDMMALLDEF